MKKNIEQVNYDGHPRADGKWWRWDEFCDRCGRQIRDKSWSETEAPDVNEVDFCVGCIEFFVDNGIKFEDAKRAHLRQRTQ